MAPDDDDALSEGEEIINWLDSIARPVGGAGQGVSVDQCRRSLLEETDILGKVETLRLATYTGRPCGSPSFLAEIEQQTGRTVAVSALRALMLTASVRRTHPSPRGEGKCTVYAW